MTDPNFARVALQSEASFATLVGPTPPSLPRSKWPRPPQWWYVGQRSLVARCVPHMSTLGGMSSGRCASQTILGHASGQTSVHILFQNETTRSRGQEVQMHESKLVPSVWVASCVQYVAHHRSVVVSSSACCWGFAHAFRLCFTSRTVVCVCSCSGCGAGIRSKFCVKCGTNNSAQFQKT